MHGAKVNRGKTRCNIIKGTDGVAMRGQKQGKKSKTFTHNGQCTTFFLGGGGVRLQCALSCICQLCAKLIGCILQTPLPVISM